MMFHSSHSRTVFHGFLCRTRRGIRYSSDQKIQELCATLNPNITTDQWMENSKKFLDVFTSSNDIEKPKVLALIGIECGIDSSALENAITLYKKNPSMSHEVRKASTPVFHHLLQSVGNLPGGVKHVCDIRQTLLSAIKDSSLDKQNVSVLRRVEESSRELLTSWFCLSNLKLQRLSWQSPGDILQKVAQYEAVHPIAGLGDIRRRVGPHRRCFYFTHESMPREPLVIVHVALTDTIADSVQKIVKEEILSEDESLDNTAIYYSISSTQKGLAGIDLGNLLIKSVVRELSREDPHISTHSTLSPIPGFRAWIIRSLKLNNEFGCIVDDYTLSHLKQLTGNTVSAEESREMLLEKLDNDRLSFDHLEPFENLLKHLCAKYLYETKRNGYAVNPVANFHLRNGAQLYRINWGGDRSVRGMKNSFGLMVNYRYKLEHVTNNTKLYVNDNKIVAHRNVCDLL